MRLRLLEFAAPLMALSIGCSAHADDLLIGSVFGTHFPGNHDGYGGALSWQHTLGADGFVLGASDSVYSIGSLSEIDADVYGPVLPHLTLSGGASLGEATSDAGSDRLYKGRVSLDSQIDAAWGVHAGYQSIELDVIHINLVTGSVEYRPTAHWAIRAGGGYNVEGSVADRYADAQVDWSGGSERFYAGIVLGRTGYDPANLGQYALIQRLFQLYLGAAIPIPVGTLTLGLDTLNLENSDRQTLRIGLTQAIKP